VRTNRRRLPSTDDHAAVVEPSPGTTTRVSGPGPAQSSHWRTPAALTNLAKAARATTGGGVTAARDGDGREADGLGFAGALGEVAAAETSAESDAVVDADAATDPSAEAADEAAEQALSASTATTARAVDRSLRGRAKRVIGEALLRSPWCIGRSTPTVSGTATGVRVVPR
jgi:hypothetical protein